MGSWRDIPAILRRCVVAVYGKTSGGGPDGVVRAFKICRDKLAKDGYLGHRGSNEILESIQLTGKGYVRNLHHISSGQDGAAKDITFSKLFEMIKPRLYEYDGKGGEQPPTSSADGSASAAERQKSEENPAAIGKLPGSDVLYPPNNPPKK
jgi:hypothetical protein